MMKKTILPLLMLLMAAALTSSAQWVRAPLPDTVAVTTLSVSGPTVLAGVPQFGVFISTDSGRTFIRRNLASFSNATGVMAIKGDTIYVTTGKACPGGSYLLRSTDFGKNWVDLYTIPDIYISAMYFSGKRIILGSVNHGIFISHNDGATFDTINDGLPRYVDDTSLYTAVYSIIPLGDHLLIGTGDGGIFTGDTVNYTWQPVSEGLPVMSGPAYFPVNEIFNDNGNLLAAMPGRGLALSGVDPIHWSEETSGFTSFYPYGFCRFGSNGVAVGADNQLFLTTDHGLNWEAWNTEPIGSTLRTVGSNGLFLFAGTADSGLWMIPERDFSIGIEEAENGKGDWSVYPNPTQGEVGIVMLDAGCWILDVVVTDMAGRVVMKKKTTGTIDLSGMESGFYLIRLDGYGQRVVIKR